MKVVIYCNNDDKNKLNGAAVTAYSIRKRGKLPDNTKYILYTYRPVQAREYPAVSVAFDEVMEPPFKIDWGKVPKWNPVRRRMWYREVWTKIVSWIKTPCDGEPVALIDYDIICLGSIAEAIPTDSFLFSGRLGYLKKEQKRAIGCNGGFLVKSPLFDDSDAPKLMMQPLYLGNACFKAKNTWNITDEGGTTWYLLNRGFSQFKALDTKFNYLAKVILKRGLNLEQKDVRLLHYAGNNKPWGNEERRKKEKNFRYICKPWDADLEEIFKIIRMQNGQNF